MISAKVALCTGISMHEPGDRNFLDRILTNHERVIVLVDGTNRSRSSHLHPFTPNERMEMLSILYPDEVKTGRLMYAGLDIEPYDRNKQSRAVRWALTSLGVEPDSTPIIGIVPSNGRKTMIKALLSGFSLIEIDTPKSTFAYSFFTTTEFDIPPALASWWADWKQSDAFREMLEEARFCISYRQQWQGSPYPPTFNAADVVIECQEKILLIVRGRPPFKGLYALPGGMIEPDEPLFNTALREAAEEVGLPEDVLEPHFIRSRTFDDPQRDPRGRFISETHLFRIPSSPPEVVAGDDAAQALWVPLSDLHPSMLSFDHGNVISEMLDLKWSPEADYRTCRPGPAPAAE